MNYKIVFVLFLITGPVIAQNFNFNQGSVAAETYHVSVPFEFVKGKIIISAAVEGEVYKFMVDTGAPNMVSRALYEKINPPLLKTLKISDSSNKKDSLDVVSLKSISIAGVEFQSTPALVDNQSILLECFEVDGIIGSNMLRNTAVKFSLSQKTMTISNTASVFNLDKRAAIPMQLLFNQSSPYFWMKLKGKNNGKVQVLFDSGMEGVLDISLGNLKQLGQLDIFENIFTSKGSSSLGLFGMAEERTQYKMTVPQIKIGKLLLENGLVHTTNAGNSRVGTTILHYADVVLDNPKQKIYFSPLQAENQNAYKKSFPIEPTYAEGKVLVDFIWNKEAVPNIEKGDEIIKINGQQCRGMELCAFLFYLSKQNKNTLELVTIDQNGEEQLTVINKE